MKNTPLVSVVVPVYNVKEYVDECLESIVGQTYENLEIILVDDASSDSSGKKCDKWASKDKRIVVEHKPVNEGLNMARKTGFDLSHGEYIAFLDSDDLFHKDNIRHSLEALINNKANVSICAFKEFSDADTKDELLAGNVTYDTALIATKNDIAKYAFFGEGVLPDMQYMTVWGKLYTRKIVEKVDWKAANYRLYEDNFWTPQALLESDRLVLISAPLIYYRRNVAYGTIGNNLGNRITGNSINGRAVGYLEFVELMREFYHKLARKYGFDPKLDKQIDEHSFLSTLWRIDNLAKAGLMESENNVKFILQALPHYIEAKNKHIDNLNAHITYLNQNLTEASQNIESLNADVARLHQSLEEANKSLESFLRIRRSIKLVLGNIIRRVRHIR